LVVPALPEQDLARAGTVTAAFQTTGCKTFRDAASFVWNLPYGRNANRADYELVLSEGRGTCSTKHAILGALAVEQKIPLELRLGIYEMTEANTPGVGPVLDGVGLRSIPEAHCWLHYLGADIDVTTPPGRSRAARPTVLLHEETITPAQIGAHKTLVHVSFLTHWLKRLERVDITLERGWRIREACIAVFSAASANSKPAMNSDECSRQSDFAF
jgi:hypothetical protein